MPIIIRNAVPSDANDLISIKRQLPIRPERESSSEGGFLLGTSLEEYRFFIEHATVFVAEDTRVQRVIGFGIILPDNLIRTSDLWTRKEHAHWSIDFHSLENSILAYYEQLAFLPGYKFWPSKLTYYIVKAVFDEGVEYLVTTTLNKPIKNLAALPFIEIAHGKHIGNIDEFHSSVGDINSDIYLISSEDFYTFVPQHPLFKLLIHDG